MILAVDPIYRSRKTHYSTLQPVPLRSEQETDPCGSLYNLLLPANQDSGFQIVRVKLLEREKPDPVILVSGNVYNKKTNEPLSASLVYEILPDGQEAGNAISNPDDGAFKIVLPYDKNYLIRAVK